MRKSVFALGSWRFPLVRGKARVKEFTVAQTREGLLLKQPLRGSFAELLQAPGAGGKKLFNLRLNMPSVFGHRKVVTIGTDWVQIGDRLFKATQPTKPVKRGRRK